MAASLPVELYRGSWVSPKAPDYGTELVKTVNAMLALERAQARASGRGGGGGRGGSGGLKVTGYGTVTDPTTGAQAQVALHGTKEERKAELGRLQKNAVDMTLANALQGKAVGDISKMSVEKGEKTLNELQTTMVNELAKNAPSLRQNFQQSVQTMLSPVREDINQRKKAVKDASSWDVLASAVSSAGNYIRQMFEPDERKGIQIARERAAQEAEDRQNNAYLENQYRRMQEGAGVWERGSGTGSRILNTLSGAIEMAPALGLTVGAGLGASAFTGPVGGAAAAGGVGALTGTADLYNRLVTEHPDWTDDQLLEAAQSGAATARIAGAATNAITFPAGKLLTKVPGVGKLIGGTGLIPTTARSYAEIAPMAVGYQMGQNYAYNQATDQDTTFTNLMQGTGDVAMSTLPFAAGIGGGRYYLNRRAAKASDTTTGTTGTTETPQNTKVSDDTQMFSDAAKNAGEAKKTTGGKTAETPQQTIDPEVRATTVESLYDILSREADPEAVKNHVRSLQDLEVGVEEIQQRVANFQGDNAQSVRDYVANLVDAETNVRDLQKSAAVRQQVSELFQQIGQLFTRDKKGHVTGYKPEAVQQAVALLDNVPDGATHGYVNAIFGELVKPKGRNTLGTVYANSKNLSKLFSFNSKSAKVASSFLREVRSARANRAVDEITQAQKLGAAVDKLREETNAGENVDTNGREGTPEFDSPDSNGNSQLDPAGPGTPEPTPDGGVAKTLNDTGHVEEGGLGGTPKPNDGATPQTPPVNETGKPVPGQGADGRPNSEPATVGHAKQGEGDGGNAAKNGGLKGGPDDAASIGKQEPASGGDAGEPVAPAFDANTARILATDAAGKRGNSKQVKAFNEAVAKSDPADAMAALKSVLDTPADADAGVLKFVQKAYDKLAKDNPALVHGQELSPVPNKPAPANVEPNLVQTVGKALDRMNGITALGARNIAKSLLKKAQEEGVAIQSVFDALDEYRQIDGLPPATVDKAWRVMEAIYNMKDHLGERKYSAMKEATPEQIKEMNRVCGR